MTDSNDITLKNKFSQLKISLLGGQVLSWKILNSANEWTEVLYQGSVQKRTGIPILFPFANPLKDDIFIPTGAKLPQHGFARDSTWSIIEQSDEVLRLSLKYKNLEPQLQEDYPYNFELFLDLDISEKNTLAYELSIINQDRKQMPIAPGLHPYFAITHDKKTSLKIDEISKFKAHSFPWDNKLEGDFFDYTGIATITFPEYKVTIQEVSMLKQFENLVVWSQNKNEKDHDFVCFEPFTRKTNAINDAPILINPKSSWKTKIVFTISWS